MFFRFMILSFVYFVRTVSFFGVRILVYKVLSIRVVGGFVD